jgi:hypothetical protein
MKLNFRVTPSGQVRYPTEVLDPTSIRNLVQSIRKLTRMVEAVGLGVEVMPSKITLINTEGDAGGPSIYAAMEFPAGLAPRSDWASRGFTVLDRESGSVAFKGQHLGRNDIANLYGRAAR